MFPDTPHISKISNHPPHIVDENDGTLSPSSFIPFCSFAGDWNITGVFTDKLNATVCKIFKETMVDGQLCYQADVEKFRDKVKDKKKAVTEGLVFWLDYNENRMVEVGREQSSANFIKDSHEDVILHIGTIGKE